VKSTWEVFFVLVVVSLSAAGVYTGLVAVGYWETVAKVACHRGAFHRNTLAAARADARIAIAMQPAMVQISLVALDFM
jgi:hypothetical protein